MRRFVFVVILSTLFATVASADSRPFTFTYDTYPVGKGNIEYEQWVTWQTHKEDEPDFDRIRFRHEFEFGLADNFDLAVYLPNWSYEDSDERNSAKFDSVSVEGIFYALNPVTDSIGLGIYTEVAVGEDEIEIENKLLLQKDIGNWTIAYNLIFETELEGVFDSGAENEVEGVLGHALGVSYAIAPGWQLGAEVLAESVYKDWSEYEHTTVWAGPAVGYSTEKWFVTGTAAYQLTDTEEEPDWQLRIIAGYSF
jgi:hypothetical protein